MESVRVKMSSSVPVRSAATHTSGSWRSRDHSRHRQHSPSSTSKLPTWNDFVHHPNYDTFWQQAGGKRSVPVTRPKVPTLNVAGWWDQEDFYGPLKIYETWERQDTDRKSARWSSAPGTTAVGAVGPATDSGPIKFDAAHRLAIPREDPGPVLRPLPQGSADAGSTRTFGAMNRGDRSKRGAPAQTADSPR